MEEAWLKMDFAWTLQGECQCEKFFFFFLACRRKKRNTFTGFGTRNGLLTNPFA